MLRTARWTLRQPRYAALAVFMLVVALICVAAGTWQISRFEQSVRDNDALKGNAHAPSVPLTAELAPFVHHGAAPGRDAIRYRTVTATGTFLPGARGFVRNQSLNGVNGYYVLAPLRTAAGVLLVVRGFVAADDQGGPPATVPPPPSTPVQVTGRLQTPDTKHDAGNSLGSGQLESINPAEQAARLGAPVYDTYLTLNARQPGTSGVTALPEPDLSNPAGGAYEAQHFAYIVQWYLFALLALAVPFAIGRHELRESRRLLLGIDPGNDELGLEPAAGQEKRLQLTAGKTSDRAVAVRAGATVARRGEPTREQWQRAARLADRYGRSVGVEVGRSEVGRSELDRSEVDRTAADDRSTPSRRIGGVPAVDRSVVSGPNGPHRSHDGYHGSYNDRLWELALADGATPSVELPGDREDERPTTSERPSEDRPPADGERSAGDR